MQLMVELFYSIMLISAGILLIKYRRNVKSWTGNFYWAEKYIGNGGTYIILILIGLFLIFWGVIYPFGGLEMLFGVNSDGSNLDSNYNSSSK